MKYAIINVGKWKKNISCEGKYKRTCHKNTIHQVQELLPIHYMNIPSLNYTNAITVTYQEACDQANEFKLKTASGKWKNILFNDYDGIQ